MTEKVNGAVQAGEFLTGNMDFFSIATLVPMAQTNVTTPVDSLYTQQGYSTWQPVVVVDGSGTAVTYSTQSAYEDALKKQSNLNLLLQTFAQRVNPVAVSISAQTVSDPAAATAFAGYLNATTFGSAYSSSATVTTVKLATEKTGQWNVSSASESNDNGYQLLAALQGLAVDDVAANVLTTNVFETVNSTNRNTIAVRALVL
jgi:hypothetical protein